MIGKTIAAIVIAVVSVMSVAIMAQDHAASKTAPAPALTLSPKVRAALVAEMASVKEGVAEIVTALAAGEWGVAARRAERIRDSFIMRQKLSPAELEELERVLPADFAEMDGQFHRHAEGLAHAASGHNYELSVFYLSKMMDGCGACHARYATHRFNGFEQAAPAKAAH